MRTPRLDRDRQQWVYDYVVKESGRVFHWDEDGRQVPKSVKSHAQISKHNIAIYGTYLFAQFPLLATLQIRSSNLQGSQEWELRERIRPVNCNVLF